MQDETDITPLGDEDPVEDTTDTAPDPLVSILASIARQLAYIRKELHTANTTLEKISRKLK